MIGYIDPGTGSYLFMLLIGGLLGVLVKFRDFWKRLWYRVTGRTDARPSEAAGVGSDWGPASSGDPTAPDGGHATPGRDDSPLRHSP